MEFAEPFWLLVGALVAALLTVLFILAQKSREKKLGQFASQRLLGSLTASISSKRRRIKDFLLIFAVFCCFIALARPQYGYQWVETKRKGIDLLFALDTSKSMLAEDIRPNRLQRAKFAILDFVEGLEGDRVGLLPFAGSAYLMCPLTVDYQAFEQSLAAVTTDLIPVGGTNLEKVIEKAKEVLDNGANHRILIIITDGENLEGDALLAAKEAAKAGLTIHTLGVGTSQGELIPSLQNPGGFVKDSDGRFVISRLDARGLGEMAQATGGIYQPLGRAGEGLAEIYRQKLALIPKEELAERRRKIPIERFTWPLALAFALLFTDFFIGERKSSFTAKTLKKSRRAGKAAGLILAFVLFSFSFEAKASPGVEAYNREDFLGASEHFAKELKEAPEDPLSSYNYGTAAYKNNLFDEAIKAFTAALATEDIDLQSKTYFNKANSHYQKGAEAVGAAPEIAENQWQEALAALDAVLQLAPKDHRAEHNREFIQKRLEELQRQLERQDNQQQQDSSCPNGQENEGEKKEQREGEKEKENGSGREKDDKGQQAAASPSPNEAVAPKKQKSAAEDETKEEGQVTENNDRIGSASNNEGDERNNAGKASSEKKEGEMSTEEALQLLQALKNEEGELNFVPAPGNGREDQKRKNW